MMPTRQGSFRLFRLFGIDVFLHWSWLALPLLLLDRNPIGHSSYVWYGLEYLTLFLIVLMHEFGHALACRSVGGQANHIILWPLGGVAYVAPPPRPGAVLWSIVAGPLVNVVLVPVLTFAMFAGNHWLGDFPDLTLYLHTIWLTNLVLLGFNLLPVYPLDGGKILWALLWFIFGRARSLMIASVIGGIAVLGLIPFVIGEQDVWLYIIAAFILLNCWRGWMEARALYRLEKIPRREGFACPVCHAKPMRGAVWRCSKCGAAFDTFETNGKCPQCATQYSTTACLECGNSRPIHDWQANVSPANPYFSHPPH